MAMTPEDPLTNVELERALNIVRAAGYDVGPRRLRVYASEVKVGDVYVGETGRYLVTDFHPHVKLIGEGSNFWMHSCSDIVVIERRP